MKWFFLGFLLTTSLWAETSKIIPIFMEASRLYIDSESNARELMFLRPDIKAALGVLEKSQIDREVLAKYTRNKSSSWPLRADDKFDLLSKNSGNSAVEVPEISVQAARISVIDQSDWTGDDIYAYFFITDGVIPTGKVTSIYKGLATGESFFFNEIDRAIFPLIGVPAKRPDNHLIIDFGIIESDGDDIKNMQKLSSIIIDLAIAVYTSYDPQNAQVVINLRKEVKALTDMLLSLNNDDRLATDTVAWKASEIQKLLRHNSFVRFAKIFKGGDFSTWEYKIEFRILRK